MRKTLIAATLISVSAVAAYTLVQFSAATPSYAFSSASVSKFVAAHAKSSATTRVKGKATGTSSTPHADGTVTAVNGDTITVTADNDAADSTEYTKVTTVKLTSSTKYPAGNGATTTTKPAIAAGQHFVAEGTVSSDGTTLTATFFSSGTGRGHGGGHGGGQAGPHADGTVTAVSGTAPNLTISVTADNDPAGTTEYTKVTTIVTNSSTVYSAGRGAPTSAAPSIAKGQLVIASGTVSSDGTTLTATHVSVHTPKS